MFQTQLDNLVDLARAFPQTTIVLNPYGSPLAIGPYAGKREDAFTEWRDRIRKIAAFRNTYVKLGELGMKMIGCTFSSAAPFSKAPIRHRRKTSRRHGGLYIESCIEAFGPRRSMFESNFPVDKGTWSYQVLWNAFKRIAAAYSADEKAAPVRRHCSASLPLDIVRANRSRQWRSRCAAGEPEPRFVEAARLIGQL
jgi:predicted TIM-barrel fold metal-dependent hydrolase